MAKKVLKPLMAMILFVSFTHFFGTQYSDALPDCEIFDTSQSSWIEGAKYCSVPKKLWVDLGDYVYLYKNVTNDDWANFKSSDQFGRGFQKHIKKKYIHAEKIDGTKGKNDIN